MLSALRHQSNTEFKQLLPVFLACICHAFTAPLVHIVMQNDLSSLASKAVKRGTPWYHCWHHWAPCSAGSRCQAVVLWPEKGVGKTHRSTCGVSKSRKTNSMSHLGTKHDAKRVEIIQGGPGSKISHKLPPLSHCHLGLPDSLPPKDWTQRKLRMSQSRKVPATSQKKQRGHGISPLFISMAPKDPNKIK